MKEISFEQACKLNPGAAELWHEFIRNLNDPTNYDPPKWVLGHISIMQNWVGDWLKHLNDEGHLLEKRREITVEIGEVLKELLEARPKPTISGKLTVDKGIEQDLGYWQGKLEHVRVKPEESEDYALRSACGRAFGEQIGDAAQKVLERIGAQQGPDYYHKAGQPYFSGPANSPQRPTVSPLIPGWVEEPDTEKCWCPWCMTYVDKPTPREPKRDNARDLSKCEDCTHQCKDGNWRMLTTAVKMGGDKRKPFNQDDNRSAGLKP